MRGVPRERRDFLRAVLGHFDLQDVRRAMNDRAQLFGRVEIETHDHAEAVAQGSRDHARARRRPHQREGLDIERVVARVGSLVDDELALERVHGLVHVLFQDARQAVNLVDEDDLVLLDMAQHAEQLGGILERRARRHLDGNLELAGNDVRECGLPQPGRSVEQHVIERVAALLRGLDEHAQVLLELGLADELFQPARAQERVALGFVGRDDRIADAFVRGHVPMLRPRT